MDDIVAEAKNLEALGVRELVLVAQDTSAYGLDLYGRYALPELLACAAVVLLHIWKRNTLLSIAGGTALYMLLVQVIFA